MIAGFELPSEGRVLLDGADVSRLPPYERDVNTVFQDYALFPHMDVADNVGYGLMIRKVPRDDRRRRSRRRCGWCAWRATAAGGRASCRAASDSASRSRGRS